MTKMQKTLKREYCFSGRGLHTGVNVNMRLTPAPENSGIVFIREDISPSVYIPALVDYVTATNRGTTLQNGGANISTIEHLLSAFVGIGVDNAFVYVDGPEVPIMDGSAKPYVEAILHDGLVEQGAPIDFYEVKGEIRLKDSNGDSELVLLPSDHYEIELTIDFNSKILGVQKGEYSSEKSDYSKEIASCRTFCFFHELEFLYKNNLIKGGDLDNALVIVENEVPANHLEMVSNLLNKKVEEPIMPGYLGTPELRFENECARHKLLDIMGDFALVGYRIKGKVIAYKSGHKINTEMAKIIRKDKIKGDDN